MYNPDNKLCTQITQVYVYIDFQMLLAYYLPKLGLLHGEFVP